MKHFIQVASGEFLYRGKVESFTYDSKTKKLMMELKSGTETFSYQEERKPYEFLTLLDSCNEDYMPIASDEEFYIHVQGNYSGDFKVIKLITAFDLSQEYWPWAAAFEQINNIIENN